MSFSFISDENIFFKTQGTRLSAIVAPNKDLEQTLCEQNEDKKFRDPVVTVTWLNFDHTQSNIKNDLKRSNCPKWDFFSKNN